MRQPLIGLMTGVSTLCLAADGLALDVSVVAQGRDATMPRDRAQESPWTGCAAGTARRASSRKLIKR